KDDLRQRVADRFARRRLDEDRAVDAPARLDEDGRSPGSNGGGDRGRAAAPVVAPAVVTAPLVPAAAPRPPVVPAAAAGGAAGAGGASGCAVGCSRSAVMNEVTGAACSTAAPASDVCIACTSSAVLLQAAPVT